MGQQKGLILGEVGKDGIGEMRREGPPLGCSAEWGLGRRSTPKHPQALCIKRKDGGDGTRECVLRKPLHCCVGFCHTTSKSVISIYRL